MFFTITNGALKVRVVYKVNFIFCIDRIYVCESPVDLKLSKLEAVRETFSDSVLTADATLAAISPVPGTTLL
jgi:hypothetical protein